MIPPFGRIHLPVSMAVRSFPFTFDPRARRALSLIDIRHSTSRVTVDVDRNLLDVRFGPWCVRTTLTNISAAELDGPYSAWKVIGPRYSRTDRGLTLATSTHIGVCLTFHTPVSGIEPLGLLRHPCLTVTVADPVELLALVRSTTPLARTTRPSPRRPDG